MRENYQKRNLNDLFTQKELKSIEVLVNFAIKEAIKTTRENLIATMESSWNFGESKPISQDGTDLSISTYIQSGNGYRSELIQEVNLDPYIENLLKDLQKDDIILYSKIRNNLHAILKHLSTFTKSEAA
ncbi:MAG: hypothetical protein N4A36_04135 [Candidatus Gracilibacteria bacterium]|jgi:hypothetical protein|nr:hypothetical protein [Candidatus Gracilibacteria bacterium]